MPESELQDARELKRGVAQSIRLTRLSAFTRGLLFGIDIAEHTETELMRKAVLADAMRIKK